MKDIVIKKRYIRRELRLFIICVLVIELVNVFAIIFYGGRWMEVFMSLGYVFTAAAFVYVVIGICRLLFAWVKYRCCLRKQ